MLDLIRREYLQALAKGSMLATLAATVPSAFVRAATGTVYDVAVYGATAAGVMAAVAAARQGANVVIITGTTQWGGMVSQGLGSTDIGNAEVIGGLARSLFGSIQSIIIITVIRNFIQKLMRHSLLRRHI